MGIVIVILGLVILGLIIYFGFLAGDNTPVVTPPENNNIIIGQLPNTEGDPTTTPGDKPQNNIQYDLSQEAPHVTNESDVVKMANAFAARLGSYSNYSNYSNFSDLEIFMTQNMRDWAKGYVAELKAAVKDGDAYYGITTTAITGKATEYNEKAGTAKIVVTTQRQESMGQDNSENSYNQSVEITLKKINGDWLVDKAYWQ